MAATSQQSKRCKVCLAMPTETGQLRSAGMDSVRRIVLYYYCQSHIWGISGMGSLTMGCLCRSSRGSSGCCRHIGPNCPKAPNNCPLQPCHTPLLLTQPKKRFLCSPKSVSCAPQKMFLMQPKKEQDNKRDLLECFTTVDCS